MTFSLSILIYTPPPPPPRFMLLRAILQVCSVKNSGEEKDICSRDADCKTKLYCKGQTFQPEGKIGHNPRCAPKKEDGKKCHYDHSCASGVCKGGRVWGGKCVTDPYRYITLRRRRRLLALTSTQRQRHRLRRAEVEKTYRRRVAKLKQLHQLSILAQASDTIDRDFAEG